MNWQIYLSTKQAAWNQLISYACNYTCYICLNFFSRIVRVDLCEKKHFRSEQF